MSEDDGLQPIRDTSDYCVISRLFLKQIKAGKPERETMILLFGVLAMQNIEQARLIDRLTAPRCHGDE